MADKEEHVELVFDSSNIESSINNAISMFDALNDGMKALDVTSIQMTKEGKLVQATFDAMLDSGQRVSATMRQLTDDLLRYNAASQVINKTTGQFAKLDGMFGMTSFNAEDMEKENTKRQAILEKRDLDLNRLAGQEIAMMQARDLEMSRLAGEEISIMQRRDLELNRLEGQRYSEEQSAIARQQALEEKRDLEMNRLAGEEIAIQQKRDLELNRIEGERYSEEQAAIAKRQALIEKRDLELNRLAGEEIAIQQKRDLELYNLEAKRLAQMEANALKQREVETQFMLNQRGSALGSGGSGGGSALGGVASAAGGFLIAELFTRAASSIKEAAEGAMQLEATIGRIEALSGDVVKSTEDWSKQLLQISNDYGTNIQDVAAAAFQGITSHAANADNIGDLMESVSKLSTITGASTADVMKLMTDSMNAFGISVDHSEQMAASFFKLIQTGNININELAHGLGNAQALANQVGLSFDDVNSVIAAMTQQGVDTSVAIKLLTNLMNLTLKPSKDMKEVFHEMGGESFEAVVKIKGLAGALSGLNQIAQEKGLSELTQQLGSWRTATGASLLTGTGFDKFQKDIQNMSGSVGEFQKRFEQAISTPGKQLEIEANKMKNFFINDVGETIINVLASVNRSIGGFTDAIKLLGEAALAGAVAWGVYKASLMVVNETVISIVSDSFTELFASVGTAGAMVAEFATIAAGAAAITAGVVAYEILTYQSEEDKYKKMQSEKIKALDEFTAHQKEAIAKQGDDIKKGIDESFKEYYDLANQIKGTYETAASNIKSVMTNINDTLRQVVDNHVNYMKTRIKDLQETITESERTIRDSAKFLEGVFASEDRRKFNIEIEDKNPGDKIEAEATRARQLNDEANKALEMSKDANITQQEKDDLLEKERNLRKEALELEHDADAIRRASLKQNKTDLDEIQKLEQDIAKTKKEMADDNQKYSREQYQDEERFNEIREKHDREQFQNAQRLAEAKNPGKHLGAFGRSAANNEASANNSTTSLEDKMVNQAEEHSKHQSELNDKLTQEQAKLKEIQDRHQGNVSAIQKQNELLKLQAELVDAIKKSEEDKIARAKEAEESAKRQKAAAEEDLRNLERLSKEAISFSFDKGGNKNLTADQITQKLAEFQSLEAKINDAEGKAGIGFGEKLNLAKDLEDKFNALKVEGSKIIGEDQVNKLTQEIQKNQDHLKALNMDLIDAQEAATSRAAKSVKEIMDSIKILSESTLSDDKTKKLKEFYDILNNPNISTKEQNNAIKEVQPILEAVLNGKYTADQTKFEAKQGVDAVTAFQLQYKEIQKNQQAIDDYSKTFPKAMDSVKGAVSDAVQSSVRDLIALKNALDDAQQAAANIKSSSNDLVNHYAPEPDWASMWTPTYATGGRPYGRDSIMARLAPGEMVMTQAATSRFYNQLYNMNMGISPHYATGGTVVGDITVNVQGTGNTESDARQMGHAIRRMIKRGQLSFN